MEQELFASLRQLGALHGEVQQMSRHKAAILPAIRPVQYLLLGLRRIRREYQIPINLWLSLCRASLPLLPPEPVQDPQPRRPDASDDLRPGFPKLPDRVLWQRCDGRSCGLQLLQPDCVQLAPVVASTSNRSPLFYLNRAERTCLTLSPPGGLAAPTGRNAPRIACCWSCGGASLPTHAAGPLPCRWCHSHGPIACLSCNHTLHYRGQCRWNCGAHMAYASDAGTLCPDCWLHWARSIAACPRRRTVPEIKACSRTFCGQPSSARSAQDSMPRWHRRCA